ncbi:MAG TPA: hypothetical protein VI456_04385 [Polyangia bacterium]
MAILKRFWRGWAVSALFGQTTAREQLLFSILIGAAVAWPLLLVGVLAPKIAVQMVALVPLPASVSAWTVRCVWIALALLIPLAVGFAVARRGSDAGGQRTRWLASIWRGFPITIALAGAFGVIFVSVPVMRIAELLRRRKSADIPLIMNASAYHQVAAKLCEVLNRQGFAFHAAAPRWWVAAPMRLLAWLGGDALRSHVPTRVEHFVTDDLSMSLYPSGLVLRGRPRRLTWAHGLIAESVVHTEGLQTTDPKAQALERRLRPLWKACDCAPGEPAADAALGGELDRIARELRTVQVDWDDWQVLYRQILQLGRALAGQPQLLDGSLSRLGEEPG